MLDEKQIQPLSLVDALAHECMFKAPVVKDTIEERLPPAPAEPIKTKDGTTKAEDASKTLHTLYVICYCV